MTADSPARARSSRTAGSSRRSPAARRRTKRSVVALVPALDEGAVIARTVKSLSSVDGIGRIVVIADGCRDETATEASGAGATVMVSRRRRGKGGAVDAILERLAPADVYLLIDGDVGDSAAEAAKLLGEVVSGRADVAIGRLPRLDGGGFGTVKRMAGWLIRTASGFEADAPLSGQRALTREAFEACRPLAGGFGLETAMTIDLVRRGFKVAEVPVEMTHRATGRTISGFVHRGRQGVQVVSAALPRILGLR